MNSTEHVAAPEPWGHYSPRGKDRILSLVTRMGLSRGWLRRPIKQMYSARKTRSPVDITRFGLKWRLHPWDNTTESKLLASSRQRDALEMKYIHESLGERGTFIDIGANAGYYSLMAARHGDRKIIAIEPNPVMLSRLRFNIETNHLNERIRIVAAAAGGTDGEMKLHLDDANLGASSGLRSHDGQKETTVPVMTLVSILHETQTDRIQAMKIDVEGMESEILFPFFQQAPQSSWPSTVVMEHIHDTADTGRANILEWLQSAGYRVIARTGLNTILRRDPDPAAG
ncbi:FkbM family methyltransferase [Thioalkalivibrio sulfidiphilus]|uniref:FkbM family methyltransferase n=1 Tax=Thioalkalivibrio sulfidiphilus TaxID=1033854 RepID=UPI003B31CB2A